MSSVWNFCRWVADIPLCETSPAAKREEKRMFLQAMFGLSTKKVAVVERWSLVEVWLYPVANKFRFFFQTLWQVEFWHADCSSFGNICSKPWRVTIFLYFCRSWVFQWNTVILVERQLSLRQVKKLYNYKLF